MPKAFKDTLNAVMQSNTYFRNLNFTQFRNHLQSSYDSLSKIVENSPLWVAHADFSSGADGKLFTGINLSTEYLQGLKNNNAKTNLELNIRAAAVFDDDLSTLSRDLDRQTISAFAGFTWIMLKNANRQSIMEFRGGLSEHYILSGLHTNENRTVFTGEGTLKVRLTTSLWIPFNIKYDPNQGNVFGYISVKSNFHWLNSLKWHLQ